MKIINSNFSYSDLNSLAINKCNLTNSKFNSAKIIGYKGDLKEFSGASLSLNQVLDMISYLHINLMD